MAKRRKKRRGGGMASVRFHGKKVARSRWKASGYSRNRKRKGRRRKLAGAALKAHLRKIGRHTPNRRRAVAKRRVKRRRSVSRRYRANPRRRRAVRHRRRRNPGFSVSGITTMVKNGVVDGAMVGVGKFGTRFLSGTLFKNQTGNTALALQGASAIGIGYLANRFIGSEKAKFVLAGGLWAVMETLVKKFAPNSTLVQQYLGDDYQAMVGFGTGAYPALPAPRVADVGSYPMLMGIGDIGDLDIAVGAGAV